MHCLALKLNWNYKYQLGGRVEFEVIKYGMFLFLNSPTERFSLILTCILVFLRV